MSAKRLFLKKEDSKKILKVSVENNLYDQIQKIKDEIKSINKSMSFNLDGIIEAAIRKSIKSAFREIESMKNV